MADGRETWLVDGKKLRALRTKNLLSRADLSELSTVSDRGIAALELGERRALTDTVRRLAKPLHVEPEELIVRDTPSDAAEASAAHAPTLPPPPPSEAALPRKVAARTELDRLADTTIKLGIAPRFVLVGKARVEVLMPPRMQDLFARHLAFAGKRFVVEGIVERPRAFSSDEARALGVKIGVGARYHVLAEIAPGTRFSVTAHATTAKLADALQAKKGERARIVVAVRVVGKNDARVVSLFASQRKRAWALVVERVI